MLMRWFAYACCAVGFIAGVFGNTNEHRVGAVLFIGGGVLIWVIVRILDKIDPEGADQL